MRNFCVKRFENFRAEKHPLENKLTLKQKFARMLVSTRQLNQRWYILFLILLICGINRRNYSQNLWTTLHIKSFIVPQKEETSKKNVKKKWEKLLTCYFLLVWRSSFSIIGLQNNSSRYHSRDFERAIERWCNMRALNDVWNAAGLWKQKMWIQRNHFIAPSTCVVKGTILFNGLKTLSRISVTESSCYFCLRFAPSSALHLSHHKPFLCGYLCT